MFGGFTMKIGMLFPGYGSQFVGMGKELYDNSRIVQEYFEEASNCLGINFVKLCFASSDSELSKITNAYPALFLLGVATATMLKETGISFSAVAGHGIGEYSALCIAQVLNFPDGLYLLTKLGQFYSSMREHLDIKSVLVNGFSGRRLRQICEENSSGQCHAHIAVYENKNEHVVSGHINAVNAVAEVASDEGAGKIRDVEDEEGFHTPVLTDLVEQLKIYLTKVDFKDPQIPIITNVDAKEVCRAKKAQDAVMRQINEPLYWHHVLKQFADMDLIVILAPAQALVAEVKTVYPDKLVLGINTMADLELCKQYGAELENKEAFASAAASLDQQNEIAK
jgi:[acyl-carrier-protein] S-malonyltransferase